MSGRESSLSGLVSMAAYLAFWAIAIAVAKKELDARLPRHTQALPAGDAAVAVLRERLALGEIEIEEYRERLQALVSEPGGAS